MANSNRYDNISIKSIKTNISTAHQGFIRMFCAAYNKKISVSCQPWLSLWQSILLFIALSGTAIVNAEDMPMPSAGALPTVEALPDLSAQLPRWTPGSIDSDVYSLLRSLPPIDGIPPAPMPKPTVSTTVNEPEDLRPIMHNMITGETIVVSEMPPLAPTATRVEKDSFVGIGADREPYELDLAAAGLGQKSVVTSLADNFPMSANAKAILRFSNGYSACSGTFVDARTVHLAAHCVWNASSGWVQEVIVFPGWNGSVNDPLTEFWGAASSTYIAVAGGYQPSSNLEYDNAVVLLDRAVGMLTGWYGLSWGGCGGVLYEVYAYPAEGCYSAGNAMTYMAGTVDACVGNQVSFRTLGGCNVLWGGESGSGLFYTSGSNKFLAAAASTSDRATVGNYARLSTPWGEWLWNTYIPTIGRGGIIETQPLQFRTTNSQISAGSSTPASVVFVNSSNATETNNYPFQVRLSPDSTITTADTLLGDYSHTSTMSPMAAFNIAMEVNIPSNTPSGTYYMGVTYSNSDAIPANNATSHWDAQRVTIVNESFSATFSNEGCRTADVYLNSNGTLVPKGNIPPDTSKSYSTNSGDVWSFFANGGAIGNYTSSRASPFYSINSAGCNSPLTVSIENSRVDESAGSAPITVRLSDNAVVPVTVTLFTRANGTARSGADFYGFTRSLTFAAGENEKIVPLTVLNDTVVESDETLGLRLTDVSGATIETGSAVLTIVDDDDGSNPTLELSDVTVSETDGTARVQINLSSLSSVDVIVTVHTRAATARGSQDYYGFTRTITIKAGSTQANVDFTIINDNIAEATETLSLRLFNAIGAEIADNAGEVTINDDD